MDDLSDLLPVDDEGGDCAGFASDVRAGFAPEETEELPADMRNALIACNVCTGGWT